jgi:hypothetical protein
VNVNPFLSLSEPDRAAYREADKRFRAAFAENPECLDALSHVSDLAERHFAEQVAAIPPDVAARMTVEDRAEALAALGGIAISEFVRKWLEK